MSRYTVFVGQRTYDVTVEGNHLLVNGDRFHFDMESLNGHGLHILHYPTRHIEAYLETDRHGFYEVQIEGRHLNAQVDFTHTRTGEEQEFSSSDITSQMPGSIVDILVKEGEYVKKGDTLLIQEAMKMQMKLCSPCSGTVRSLPVHRGKNIDKGVLLASIEPDERDLCTKTNSKRGNDK